MTTSLTGLGSSIQYNCPPTDFSITLLSGRPEDMYTFPFTGGFSALSYYLRVVKTDGLVDAPQITIYVEPVAEAPAIARFTVNPGGTLVLGQCVLAVQQLTVAALPVAPPVPPPVPAPEPPKINRFTLNRRSKSTCDTQACTASTSALFRPRSTSHPDSYPRRNSS